MWHEARRQEKKIRKVIVDYKKRSERRHQYYERIRQDPTKFLQVHGRKCKIHLDGTVATEADNNNHMMPWQGDNTNMIDRFDVRAHLDYYRDASITGKEAPITEEEQKCNFESYRVLIWNEYKKISEHQHLKQICIDEQFPGLAAQNKQKQDVENQKQILAHNRATIGYNYEDNMGDRSWHGNKGNLPFSSRSRAGDDISDDDEDEFDILQELEEIPPLSEISIEAITAMDDIGGKKFGLSRGGFGDCLVDDQNHLDKVSAVKELETEKRKFSGRRSRRERRVIKDEYLQRRQVGELSFVYQDSSETSGSSDSASSTGSDSTDNSEPDEPQSNKRKNNIEYITSFGGVSLETSAKSACRRRSESASPEPRRYHRSRSRSPRRTKKISSCSSRRSRSQDRNRDQHRSRERPQAQSSNRSRGPLSKERRTSKSSSHEHRSDTQDGRQSMISSVSQSTESLMKNLARHKNAEEKAAAIRKLTPQQKLKIKMQRALNKQLKVDRHADMEKRMVKQQELAEREDDLRDISRKIRKRESTSDGQSRCVYPEDYK